MIYQFQDKPNKVHFAECMFYLKFSTVFLLMPMYDNKCHMLKNISSILRNRWYNDYSAGGKGYEGWQIWRFQKSGIGRLGDHCIVLSHLRLYWIDKGRRFQERTPDCICDMPDNDSVHCELHPCPFIPFRPAGQISNVHNLRPHLSNYACCWSCMAIHRYSDITGRYVIHRGERFTAGNA